MTNLHAETSASYSPAKSSAISVVVPCYRCSKTIDRAISSVLAQTFPLSEIIIVDDCSGDGTLEKLLEIRLRNDPSQIKVVALERNSGPATARNAGWREASGDFIAFLDSDDSWHPQKLELQIRHMRENPEIILCGHPTARSMSTKTFGTKKHDCSLFSGHQILYRNPFTPTSAIVRKNLPLRFREGHRHMEDHLFWMEVAFNGHVVARLEEQLALQYKAPYGEDGLSADLLAMEFAELKNGLLLYQAKFIDAFTLTSFWIFSLAKFLRRLIIAKIPLMHKRQITR